MICDFTDQRLYMGVTSGLFGPAGDGFVMFLSSPPVLSCYVSACFYLQYVPNKARIECCHSQEISDIAKLFIPWNLIGISQWNRAG